MAQQVGECFGCGQEIASPADGIRYAGAAGDVLTLCLPCGGRLLTQVGQTLTYRLQHDRAPKPDITPRAVSPSRAAHLLGRSRSHIYQLIQSGELPAIRIGSRLSVPMDAIEDLMQGGAA